jgi:hypothetical protein
VIFKVPVRKGTDRYHPQLSRTEFQLIPADTGIEGPETPSSTFISVCRCVVIIRLAGRDDRNLENWPDSAQAETNPG